MTETHDCGGDAAAYVLGALEPDEVEAFRAHLVSCVVCRDEVAAFRHVADALPMSAVQYAAPRSLRRRVLRAVRSEQADSPRAARAPGRLPPWPATRRRTPAVAVGALVVLALATVGAVELGSSGSTAPRVIASSVGRADVRLSGGHAELIVRHLPPPPAGDIYEVWLQRGQRAPSPTSTLFSVTSTGVADVGLTGDLHGVSRVLVTPERAGGSQVPTHAPVIVAQLS